MQVPGEGWSGAPKSSPLLPSLLWLPSQQYAGKTELAEMQKGKKLGDRGASTYAMYVGIWSWLKYGYWAAVAIQSYDLPKRRFCEGKKHMPKLLKLLLARNICHQRQLQVPCSHPVHGHLCQELLTSWHGKGHPQLCDSTNKNTERMVSHGMLLNFTIETYKPY